MKHILGGKEQQDLEMKATSIKAEIKDVESKIKKLGKEPVKITRWMLFKAKATAKWVLFKVFLIKFFDIKQLAFVTFTYEIICGYKNPKREKHVVLAKVSRNAPVEEVKKKLFTLKAPEDCTFKVVEAKIQSVGKVKSV